MAAPISTGTVLGFIVSAGIAGPRPAGPVKPALLAALKFLQTHLTSHSGHTASLEPHGIYVIYQSDAALADVLKAWNALCQSPHAPAARSLAVAVHLGDMPLANFAVMGAPPAVAETAQLLRYLQPGTLALTAAAVDVLADRLPPGTVRVHGAANEAAIAGRLALPMPKPSIAHWLLKTTSGRATSATGIATTILLAALLASFAADGPADGPATGPQDGIAAPATPTTLAQRAGNPPSPQPPRPQAPRPTTRPTILPTPSPTRVAAAPQPTPTPTPTLPDNSATRELPWAPANGLAAYWSFNDEQNLLASTGLSSHTLQLLAGNLQWRAAGFHRGACQIGGMGMALQFPDELLPVFQKSFAWTAWCTLPGTDGRLLSLIGDQRIDLRIRGTRTSVNSLSLTAYQPGARGHSSRFGGKDATVDGWSHVIIQSDLNTRQLSVYLGGKLAQRIEFPAAPIEQLSLRAAMIGLPAERTKQYDIVIDEMRVYSRILTDEEIQKMAGITK